MDTPRSRVASALSLAVYALGAGPVTLAVAFLYGVSRAPRGSLIDGALVAGAAGVLHWIVLIVSRCRHTAIAGAVLAMTLLSFVGGHLVGYGEARSFAWDYVHRIAPEKFTEPEWGQADPDENFRRFVGWVTGTPGNGAFAYLRLQASIGTAEQRVGRGAAGRYGWTMSGLLVWGAWLAQMLLLLVGYGAAVGAVLPDEPPRPTE